MAVLLVTFSLFIGLIIWAYFVLKRKYSYWEKKKVPHLKPVPFFGNYTSYLLMNKTVGVVTQELCQAFPNEPYVGSYYGVDPALIIKDPELIKLVTTKDFYYFNSRENMEHVGKEYIGLNLFFHYGDQWKVLRQNLSPLFTSGKMKQMFYLIEKCSESLERMVQKELRKSNAIDTKALTARYTIACIGACVFDLNTNSIESSEGNPFIEMGDILSEQSVIRGLFWALRGMYPGLFYAVGLTLLPAKVKTFFYDLQTAVFEKRNYKPAGKNDFVDLLLELKNNKYITGDSLGGGNKKIDIEVDDEFLVSQGMLFFSAGFETSATVLSFTLYELAKNKNAQERAAAEAQEFIKRHNGKLTYDCVNELPYMEACMEEAMRLYPVLGVITREVVTDYTLPTGLKLERGTRIHLPVYHLHKDPKNFPDPEAFKPERFLPEYKGNIKPYTYLPFGEGQRICIGMRFAKMQSMSCLVTLLKSYHIELAEGTPKSVTFDPRAIQIAPRARIKLKFIARENAPVFETSR